MREKKFAIFCCRSGLAEDAKSLQLLAGLVEAAMKSPFKGDNDFLFKSKHIGSVGGE